MIMIFLFWISSQIISHQRNWHKENLTDIAKLQFLNGKIYCDTKNSHLALGNKTKLVFCSIVFFKNWSLKNCVPFLVWHYLWWEVIWDQVTFAPIIMTWCLMKPILTYICLKYREAPTYLVFTTTDPTTAIFGLCKPRTS